ncbi:hypothetical protein [Candidatus Methylacidithermus pantelleriae]|uniref:Uncharacterized protein n=1 Tax=Candidatus Methylacidithermus pantelleriae TaxID=2744239 RepID=A0A8J2BLP7_9BACT|nr:hypothetical protein [Candidatus Methylacidithermus pantelleriae]CAF0688791.1 hypothetical protein MPNT_10008 [Candidatus Methylacidithermus pantelleriae]
MSDRARWKTRLASAKEVLADIRKTIAPKADPLKLASPVGWCVFFCLQPHKYFGVGGRASRPLLAETYREERLPEEEAIHGWYLPELRLLPPEGSSLIISDVPRFELAFPQLKSSLEARPVYHWRGGDPSPQYHQDLFPAYGLTARLREPKGSGKACTEKSPKLLRGL